MKNIYFAAANSYVGFYHHFQEVFPSKEFRRIYVLKGGPGVGKSTFLRSVSKLGEDKHLEVTEILCSSDPASLDGVILENQDGMKVGLLDGTAPHERDAVMAGTVDRLLDFGLFRDDRKLEAEKDRILSLAERKSKDYRRAYFYLKLCGNIDTYIKAEMKSRENAAAIRKKIQSLCKDFSGKENAPASNPYLLSCFGKNGYHTLPNLQAEKRIVSLTGRYGSEYLFLNRLDAALEEKRIPHTAYRHALCPDFIEAIDVTDEDTAFLASPCSDEISETEQYYSGSRLLSDSDLHLLTEQRENFQKESVKYFSDASDRHFDLEAIYAPSMLSELRQERCEEILFEIGQLFS